MKERSARIWLFVLLFLVVLPSFTLLSQHTIPMTLGTTDQQPIQSDYFVEDHEIGFVEYARYDDNGGNAEGIALKDGIAYVANSNQGLEIINFTDPLNPVKLSSLDPGGIAVDVCVENDLVYLSISSAGVAIINVANPRNPYIVKIINPGGSVKEVDVRTNLLYIITGFYGLYIYDITNPYDPKELSTWDNGGFHTGISVLNKDVCLANGGEGVEILDLTFPDDPFLVGFWNQTTGYCYGVYAALINNQKYAFLASSTAGLEIINFTSPSTPSLVGSYNGWGLIYDVVIENEIAYCCSNDLGIVLLNVSDPVNPTEITTYDSEGYTRDVAIENDLMIFSSEYDGVKAFDVSNPFSIQYLSRFLDHGIAFRLERVGDLLYVADRSGGLEIFDISTPSLPTKIGQYRELNIIALDVLIEDDLAVISAYDHGVIFINISDPTNPQKIETYMGETWARVTAIKGDLLFVGGLNDTIEVLNISDLQSITVEGEFVFSYASPSINSMVIKDDILIVGDSARPLYLFNISDITNIVEMEYYDSLGICYDLELNNDLLYVANGPYGVQLFNVSSNHFDLISEIDTSHIARSIELSNEIVFVADQNNGIEILNFSDLANPFDAGGYTQSHSYDIETYGQYLLSASWDAGVFVLALDSDSDALTDLDEVMIWGTNPYSADTDEDQMPDGFEVNNMLNPLDSTDADEDPDEDGLTNLDEYIQKFFYSDSTDPNDSDSDDDLMPDGYEVENNLDPLVANGHIDTDSDNLTNLEEYYLGTDPRDKDTDGDDADDDLEVFYGTDPLDAKDNPKRRQIIRVFTTLGVVLILIILGIVFIVRFIKKRIARNIEREKRILEAEDQVLLF